MEENIIKIIGASEKTNGWFTMTLEYKGKLASYQMHESPTPEQQTVIDQGILMAKQELGIVDLI